MDSRQAKVTIRCGNCGPDLRGLVGDGTAIPFGRVGHKLTGALMKSSVVKHSIVIDEATLEVVDATDLTDAHWPSIDRLKRAYEARGMNGFWDELERLSGDFVFQITIASAFFPAQIREALKGVMADYGLTMEDLREILEKEKDLPAES